THALYPFQAEHRNGARRQHPLLIPEVWRRCRSYGAGVVCWERSYYKYVTPTEFSGWRTKRRITHKRQKGRTNGCPPLFLRWQNGFSFALRRIKDTGSSTNIGCRGLSERLRL